MALSLRAKRTHAETCGAKLYRLDEAWKKLYSEDFTVIRKKIIGALNQAVCRVGWGNHTDLYL